MARIEWGLISDKKYAKNKYSITDIISFIVTAIAIFLAINIFMENYNVLSYFGISESKAAPVGIALVLIGILNFFAGLNVAEDLFNTLMRVFLLYFVVLHFGGNFDNVKIEYQNISVGGNNYSQVPQLNNSQPTVQQQVDTSEAQKWMDIGVSQGLVKGTRLTSEGKVWCNTQAAKGSNQGRLHCKTGYTWSKNGWSNRNDTF